MHTKVKATSLLIPILVIGICSISGCNSYRINKNDTNISDESIFSTSSNCTENVSTTINYTDLKDSASEEYVSFINDNTGYLLLCSEPAGGMMSKYLFYTEDTGQTYTNGLELSIPNYPVGIIFFDQNIGFILTDYHGTNEYLYYTEDGGITWNSISLEIPTDNEFRYIQGVSIGKDNYSQTNAELYLEGISDSEPVILHYITQDSGTTWQLSSE